MIDKRIKIFFQIRKFKGIKRSGERGIRTLGTNNSYNGLAIRRFSPLSHLSQLKIGKFSCDVTREVKIDQNPRFPSLL